MEPPPPQTSAASLGSLYCWLLHYEARDSTILSSGVIICCNACRSQENGLGAIPALLLRTQLKNSQIEEMNRPRHAGFLDTFFDIWYSVMYLIFSNIFLLEKGMTTHSYILAWRIPWTEEAGGLQSVGRRELDMAEATLQAYLLSANVCLWVLIFQVVSSQTWFGSTTC